MVKFYVEKYPIVRPVTMALKRYMQVMGFNSSFMGGFSSYTMFLMVMGYLNFFNLTSLPG
jgi:DNA polymerase sigma